MNSLSQMQAGSLHTPLSIELLLSIYIVHPGVLYC